MGTKKKPAKKPKRVKRNQLYFLERILEELITINDKTPKPDGGADVLPEPSSDNDDGD